MQKYKLIAVRQLLLIVLISILSVINSVGRTITLTKENSCQYSCRNGDITISIQESTRQSANFVRQIFESVSLQPTFRIMSGKLLKRIAVAYIDTNFDKLILIDESEISKMIINKNSSWPAIFILAHECGHHLNGDNLAILSSIQNGEEKADEFAGNILYKLGASLSQTLSALNSLSSENCGDHPAKELRIVAAHAGWNKAHEEYQKLHGMRGNTNPSITEESTFNVTDNFDIYIKENPVDYTPNWSFIHTPLAIKFNVDNYVASSFTGGTQEFYVQMAGYNNKIVVKFNPFVTCDCITDLEIPSHAKITDKAQVFRLVNFRKAPREGNGAAGGPCMGLNNAYFAGGWDGEITLRVNAAGNLIVDLQFQSYKSADHFSGRRKSYRYWIKDLEIPVQFVKEQ